MLRWCNPISGSPTDASRFLIDLTTAELSASSLLRFRVPADRGTTGRSGELPVLADPPGYSDQSPMTHQARAFSGRTPSVSADRRSSSRRGARADAGWGAAGPASMRVEGCQRPATSIVPLADR
jgi:hypothetical protein